MADTWLENGEAWVTKFEARRREESRGHAALETTLRVAREGALQHRRDNGAAANVIKWFRQLPPELAFAIWLEMKKNREDGKGTHGDTPEVRVANDWLLERGFNAKTPAPRRPMSADERAMALALRRVSFGSGGGFDKRFGNQVVLQALQVPALITDGQARVLPGLVTRYRRQLRVAAIVEPGSILGVDRELPPGVLPHRLRDLVSEERAEAANAAREKRKASHGG